MLIGKPLTLIVGRFWIHAATHTSTDPTKSGQNNVRDGGIRARTLQQGRTRKLLRSMSVWPACNHARGRFVSVSLSGSRFPYAFRNSMLPVSRLISTARNYVSQNGGRLLLPQRTRPPWPSRHQSERIRSRGMESVDLGAASQAISPAFFRQIGFLIRPWKT